MTQVAVLMRTRSRHNGGLSSALDLAESLFSTGYDTYVGVSVPKALFLARPGRFAPTCLPFQRFFTMPAIAKIEAGGTGLRSAIRSAIYVASEYVERPDKYFAKSEIIFDCAATPIPIIKRIRHGSSARMILNHAGSPDAFMKYFLNSSRLGSAPEFASLSGMLERYKFLLSHYDGVLYQSPDHMADSLELTGSPDHFGFCLRPSCKEEAVVSAANCVSPYGSDAIHIVCVGSLQERKAQHLALEVLNRIEIPGSVVFLHFVGGSPTSLYGRYLKKRTKALGLESRVSFHGFREDYLRFMAHADLLIQTSEEEGVSRVLREAMLLKTPIVAFGIKGTSYALRDSKDALLCKFGDVEKFADLCRAILLDKGLKASLVASALSRYFQAFSKAAYLNSMRDMVTHFLSLDPR